MTDDSPSLFVLGSFVAACSVHVSRFPQPGETAQAAAFTLEAGGKGLNLAIGARRLGASVDGLLAIGDDLFGRLAAPALEAAGLDPRMLCLRAGPTGAGVGFIDEAGETCLAVYPGANALLAAEDVLAARHRIVETRLVLAQFEIADAPIAAGFSIARAAGVPTLLNPSPYRRPSPDILRDTTILVVNQVEANALVADIGGVMDRIFAHGPQRIVLTRGPEGATVHDADGTIWTQPAFAVPPIDSLGAGDAFSAGLAASLVAGRPFPDALRWAAACGAMAACHRGVLHALPTVHALEEFLALRAGEACTTRNIVRL